MSIDKDNDIELQPLPQTIDDTPEESTPLTGSIRPSLGSAAPPQSRGKLLALNWLKGISDTGDFDAVEVMFKNTRVGFFSNPFRLNLKIGDIVAVEAAPGHDIGRVTMVGRLVRLQMKKNNVTPGGDLKKVFRIATQNDLDKFDEARAREHDTMIRSRKIAEELGLNMKIGDVEYQGDGGKAIFYYIADERVDFRKLIRILADTFKVRIEMKQIGARQEAGRIGGIGPCGRPLCCSSWMTHFVSVGTGAARMQDLSMNPQKLAGQCAKLKCCLNFEIDSYTEARRKLPARDVTLETKDNTYFYFKPDILAGKITYSTDKSIPANLVTIDIARAFEIIALNKQGVKVDSLSRESEEVEIAKEYIDLTDQDSLTRFDKSKKKKKKKKASTSSDDTNKGQKGEKTPKGQNGERPIKKPKSEKPENQPGQQSQPREQRADRQERRDKQDRKPQNKQTPRKNNQDANRQQRQKPPKKNEEQ